MFQESLQQVVIPTLMDLYSKLEHMAIEHANVPMLSRTHGQSASPTTVGKELANFAYRIHRQIYKLKAIQLTAKCNGAVGNFNVHLVTFPNSD